MLKRRHANPVTATLSGLLDRFRRPIQQSAEAEALSALLWQSRGQSLAGMHCLITGATSGLGLATAQTLLRRGATLYLPTRSAVPEELLCIARDRVKNFHVDFLDLETIPPLVQTLAGSGAKLDLVVLNAGVMTRSSRRSAQGLESMFAVNYLANFALLRLLLSAGLLGSDPERDPEPGHRRRPRIVLVSSEAHRSAAPIDFSRLGEWVEFDALTGMRQYAHTKLLLCTWMAELARRLDPAALSVAAACPGPVDSRIAREAPPWVAPLLRVVMRIGFRSPTEAAEPIVQLGVGVGLEGKTGHYLHLEQFKSMSDAARSASNGARLWAASEQLLSRLDFPAPELPPGLMRPQNPNGKEL